MRTGLCSWGVQADTLVVHSCAFVVHVVSQLGGGGGAEGGVATATVGRRSSSSFMGGAPEIPLIEVRSPHSAVVSAARLAVKGRDMIID